MPTTQDAADIYTRIDRIKKLCDELTEAQGDTQKYREIIERIKREASAFQATLATHDSRV